MKSDFLNYYHQELHAIRKTAKQFAKRNPKVAAHLGLNESAEEDPFVARLIEAVAFLTARLQSKMDDDLLKLSEALCSLLCPSLIDAVPSMAMIQVALDAAEISPVFIKRHALLTKVCQGEGYHFRTAYPLSLYPIKLAKARLQSKPFSAPNSHFLPESNACLMFEIRRTNKSVNFFSLGMNKVRFYIQADINIRFKIYELIFAEILDVAIVPSNKEQEICFVGANAIEPVGFQEDDELLPVGKTLPSSHQGLIDFFMLPDKYLFFDINLSAADFKNTEDSFCVFFYLREVPHAISSFLNESVFLLNVIPVVNLFSKQAEPIKIDHGQQAYQIVPDAHHPPEGIEIYRVESVFAMDAMQQPTPVPALFGIEHGEHESAYYWEISRKPSWQTEAGVFCGDDVFLSLCYLKARDVLRDFILKIDILCTNRDSIRRLAHFLDEIEFTFPNGEGENLKNIKLLTPFTKHYPSDRGRDKLWRLISSLNLNYLALEDAEKSLMALKEVIFLYARKEEVFVTPFVRSLVGMQVEKKLLRCGDRFYQGFYESMLVTLTLDENFLPNGEAVLWGKILCHFFLLQKPINQPMQCVIISKQRGKLGEKCL